MFPLRENLLKNKFIFIPLIIMAELTLLFVMAVNYSIFCNLSPFSNLKITPQETKSPIEVADLKDNWELAAVQTYFSEKLYNLAEKYHVEPDYLNYIVKVEKTFNLEPCELLALIAQESGFKPQTHMDGGSLSYSTTQMKLPAAKTAYKAITEYYHMDIPYPTDELLKNNQYYATILAGGISGISMIHIMINMRHILLTTWESEVKPRFISGTDIINHHMH
jgi:hypothetical protein